MNLEIVVILRYIREILRNSLEDISISTSQQLFFEYQVVETRKRNRNPRYRVTNRCVL